MFGAVGVGINQKYWHRAARATAFDIPRINIGMDIYHHFERLGLTDSHRHFSRAWLNRAENNLCLRAGRGPSADALVELFQTLWRERRPMLAARVAWAVLWLPQEARR